MTTYNFYVSPSGDNNNDGLSVSTPFQTIQHAVDQVPNGGICNIELANGTYTENVNCVYHRVFQINGTSGSKDNVVIEGSFWAQDHVILTIQNLSCNAIRSRQYAIMDYYNINFMNNPGDWHVAANECSKINNLGNIHILGNAYGHMAAGHGSIILSSASITVPYPVNLSYFALASRHSIIELGDVYSTGIYGLGMTNTTGTRFLADSTSVVGVDPNFYWGAMT